MARLPYDLKLCDANTTEDCLRPSVAEAQNAQFLQTKGEPNPLVKVQTGTLRSTTEIDPQIAQTAKEISDDKAVIWNGYGTVVWVETNEMISQYKAGLAIDRDSAAAVNWGGQFLQDAGPDSSAEVTFAGQLYKFPFGTEKKDYEYFDRDLRKALPIEYQGTEDIQGLETYRFQQVIPDTQLNFSADRLTGLLNTFAPDAVSGQVTYSNTRTIWVEPVSGTFIKVQEQQKKQLVPDAGAPTQLLDGNFVYTDETVTNNVNSAGETKSSVLLISRTLPIALAVIGALLLILGLWMVVTGRRAAASKHRNEEITEGGKVSA